MNSDGVVVSKLQIPIPDTTLQRWVFVESVVANEDKPILVDAHRPGELSLSMRDYRRLSLSLAAGLGAAGFHRGERLLIVSQNSVYCPVVFMGTITAGGIYCTADPAYDESDLARTIAHLEPSIVVAAPEQVNVVSKAMVMTEQLSTRLFIFSGDPDHAPYLESGNTLLKCWTSLFMSNHHQPQHLLRPACLGESDETVAIIYSSGTTGMPKGVRLSHKNYIAASIGHNARLQGALSQPDTDWRVLGALSMHHVLGQRAYGIIFPLLSVTTYIARARDHKQVLRLIDELDINFAILRSPVVTQMVKNPATTRAYKLRSLRRIEACATSLDPSIRKAAERALSRSSPVQVAGVWGLTELGLISGWDLEDVYNNGSVGELHANYEGRVVLSDGQVATRAGSIGEIQIRTPSATRGYWRNAEATRALHREGGWIGTGDLGYVDETDKWFIVDRIKDLIKRDGTYISPTELEGILLEHPSVSDVAVVGMPVDEDEGPVAFVVPTDEATCTPVDLEDFVNCRVPPYKRLVGGVTLTQHIPRNAQGKANRVELRRLALGRRPLKKVVSGPSHECLLQHRGELMPVYM